MIVMGSDKQGRWAIDGEETDYWVEDVVPWDNIVYPDEEPYSDESESPVGGESESEFTPSGSTSE